MHIMKHFVFGYGSLICPQSRAITAPTLEDAIAEPVVINGIERIWSARVTKRQSHSSTGKDDNSGAIPSSSSASNGRDHIRGWTPMGVRFQQNAKCNGVLIAVDEEELMRFDIREAGYDRRKIDLADIHCHIDSERLIDQSMALWPDACDRLAFREQLAIENVKCSECREVFVKASEERRRSSELGNEDSASMEKEEVSIWVYVQNENYPADRSYPITQSYLDIIIRGCLSVSHDFARRFLQTTHGWWHDGDQAGESNKRVDDEIDQDAAEYTIKASRGSIDDHHTWVNDRLDPMYVRADSEYSSQNAEQIDQLIEEHHPHALKRRVVSM